MTNNIVNTCNPFPLSKVSDLLESVYVSQDFQRRVVWSNKAMCRYIESVNNGFAATPIVVSDIASLYDTCEELSGPQGYGARKARRIKESVISSRDKTRNERYYKYISLDGQNRTHAILKLLDLIPGEEALYFSGKIRGQSGEEHVIKNKQFKDWDKDAQAGLLSSTVFVTVIYNLRWAQLAKVFADLNDGSPLNHTEMRNAMPTPLAPYLRNLAQSSTWAKSIRKVSGVSGKLHRMSDIHLVSKVFLHLNSISNMHQQSLSQLPLNKFFEQGIGSICLKDAYHEPNLQRSEKIFDIVRQSIDQRPNKDKIVGTETFWSLVFAAEYIFNQAPAGVMVSDYGTFYRKVERLNNTLIRNSKRAQGKLRESLEAQGKLSEEEIDKECHDDNFYWRCVQRNEQGSPRFQRCAAFQDKLANWCKSSENMQKAGLSCSSAAA